MHHFIHHNGFLPHWVVLAALAGIVTEIIWYATAQKRAYPWREMLASIAIAAIRVPIKLTATLVILPVSFFLYAHRLTTIPLNAAWGIALLFLAEEFAYYWMHRSGHEIRWLWASHVVHHTPEHIHFASAFRIGATEFLSGTWLFFLPLAWIGFSPVAVSTMLAINLFFQFWLHTDLVGRLGPIEWIFNTPSHHRVHHASNPEYLDRNYGGILIIWDRLFGTFAREKPDTKIVYGLVHPIGSLNPFKILTREWMAMARDTARARSWRERLVQMFGRPGALPGKVPALARPSPVRAAE